LEAVYIGCLYACKYSTKIEQMSMAENPLRAIQVGVLTHMSGKSASPRCYMDNVSGKDNDDIVTTAMEHAQRFIDWQHLRTQLESASAGPNIMIVRISSARDSSRDPSDVPVKDPRDK